jgi:S-DNA-T family DNA segregation ATPase FtsK/SpoIIIE
VITGLIKSNLPARIAFQVASRTDSRVVLDEMGADKLLGNGDMLFLWPGTSTLLRGQGAYVSDDEITRVVDFVGTTEPQFVHELVQLQTAGGDGKVDKSRHQDELYDSAVDIVIREGRGSVSLLQRALGIGYGRAARLIDFMAEDGIVGQYNGSQAREVVVTAEQWATMCGEAPPEIEAPRPPRNVIRPSVAADENSKPGGRKSSSGMMSRLALPAPKANPTAPDDELDEEDDEQVEEEDDWDKESDADDELAENDEIEDEEVDEEEEDDEESDVAAGDESDLWDSDDEDAAPFDGEENDEDDGQSSDRDVNKRRRA